MHKAWSEKLREIDQQIGLLDDTIRHWSDNGEWTLRRGPGHLVIHTDTCSADGNTMCDSGDSDDSDSEVTGSRNPPSGPEKTSNPRARLNTLLVKLKTLPG